ncbi:MAG: hypothetical protein HN742_06010 [Lentisphaerae bacterium]|nr:hypothetical protein [Lentisphaerota bacterium]MBT4820718.1 hypothetical protein [Lentisphaerota bacterium]MBT5609647.1 hypothetical protein [Lentisphaerota bacterium]MBT7055247.1 hypothetical protein [Lentisphaerota bacterium]MBT7841405.1 hypothetical protein [Lentisphaerota bacterium]
MQPQSANQEAILLVGPTGAGKSPLGDALECHGHHGRRCWHFDFGANLRLVAAGDMRPDAFTDADVAFVQCVLSAGALLEDETFYIAEGIFRAFIDIRPVGVGDVVILNGLPRHVGQARDVARFATVVEVIALACTPEVVEARVCANVGGDRAERTDDSLAEVRRKLEIFRQRTAPLIEYYCSSGVPLTRVDVMADMTADGALSALVTG